MYEIIKIVYGLKEMRDHIKAIHLNSSFGCVDRKEYGRGEYEKFMAEEDVFERFRIARMMVSALDCHNPFKSVKINDVVRFVQPEHVVLEFIARDFTDLDNKIRIQNEYLNFNKIIDRFHFYDIMNAIQ